MIVRIAETNEEIQSVSSIDYEDEFSNNATIANIEIFDKNEVDKLEPDETIEILESDDIVFIGKIKELPTGDNKRTYTIKLRQKYTENFEYESNGRIFYNVDSGAAMASLITEDIDSRGIQLVHAGDNLSGIESNAPVFELGDFRRLKPEKYGSDLLFIGFPRDDTDLDTYHVTFSNVDFRGDIFHSIYARTILNNLSNVFDLTVNYIDDEGKNYVWDLGDDLDGVETLELNAEEASDISTDDTLNPSEDTNKLRFIIELNGTPVESRAIAIDSVQVMSVDIVDRYISFNDVQIPETGRLITRKFTETVSEDLFSILEEEDGKIIVDNDDIVRFIERGGRDAPLEIIEGETPIVDYSSETNPDEIVNQVVVQGSDGIVVKRSSQSSKSYFGFTNTRKIRDESIKTERDAESKANQILDDYSFIDTKLNFEMPNISELKKSNVGDTIYVDWDGIQTEFIILSKSTTDRGFQTITLEASSRNT